MPPQLRIEVIDKEVARRMLINHLRAVHPDWEQAQIEQEAARRLSHGTV